MAQAPVSSGFVSISGGVDHSCGLTYSGGVKCWGSNAYGQAGDGAGVDRLTQVDVPGLASGVTAITTGSNHTCALTSAGGVKCWGINFYGQLGDNSTTTRLTPVNVTGLTSGVIAIGAGLSHTCAVTTAGAVKCWGDNNYGQLGDGTRTMRQVPTDVIGLQSGMSSIAAGAYHTCALAINGSVKCWGDGAVGQLGNGINGGSVSPVDVTILNTAVRAIAAGYDHTCALTMANGIKCWGRNAVGQLGDGNGTTNFSNSLTAVDVIGLTSGVSAIALDGTFSCALTIAGGVKCWGGNPYGQLGDMSLQNRLSPVDVQGLTSGVTAIGAGWNHVCAVTSNGGGKCWGDNGRGQLGDGTTTQRRTPVNVLRFKSNAVATAGGGYHNCVLTETGGVKCWGNNNNGQLGDTNTTSTIWLTAVDVTGLTNGVAAITTGEYHSCALTVAGGAMCWGRNAEGQVGDGTITSRWPTSVTGLATGVKFIAAGYRHTCAVTTTGMAKCWGDNSAGQLGDSTTTNRLVPTSVPGLGVGVSVIAPGQFHTCAVATGGAVKCWGSNIRGQVGDGSTTQRLTLTDVVGLSSGVRTLALGLEFTCALTTAGAVKCWGRNADGQLGDGTTIDKLTPVDVVGLSAGVSEISAGTAQVCALMIGGGVKCWGFNDSGRLGDGTTISRTMPVDVLGLTSGVSAIGVGSYHGCAVVANGGVKCWGDNNFGALGDNTTSLRITPVNTSFTYNVSPSASGQGSISPGNATTVTQGEAASFSLTANAGYAPQMAGTCGGILSGAAPNFTYTTFYIYGNCTVVASFNAVTSPGAPVITNTMPSSGQASVAFTTPSDGGSAITAYTLTCGPFSATAAASPITVSGLSNGSTYSCAVTATNALGTGSASASVSVTPVRVPDAPVIGVASAGNTQAAIAFSPPAADGGSAITGYTATCTPGPLVASGYGSPLTVTGMINNLTYTCSVTAANLVGTSPASASVGIAPLASVIFALTGARSRKTHGSAGPFDLPIDTTLPIGGPVSVESRLIGGGHTIVLQFNGPVSSAGTVSVTPVGTATAAFLGNEVLVTLANVPDNRRATISLLNVNGTLNLPPISLGFLTGDVNNTRSVNSSDISSVKARSGQATTAANFNFDLNASGAINSSDISAVKARSGLTLP